jgi:hypothetical protein
MGKKNFKQLAFVSLTLFALIFALALVSASPTLVSPASSATISGATVLLNATNGTLSEILNCTFYASSPSTANSTAVSIGSAVNESASDLDINMTFNSAILEDSNDYSIYASCWNATTQQNSSARTGITVDNTIPQAPSSLTPATYNTVTTAGTQTFSSTVTNQNTTSCTYTIYRGGSSADGNSGSATYSSSTCSFTKAFSTTSDNGEWWWTITASDGTNTTSSSTNHLTVNLPGKGGGALPLTTSGDGTTGSKKAGWVIMIIIVLAVVGLIYAFTRKKDN